MIHSDNRLSCLNSKASVSSNIPSVYSSKSCSRQKIPSKTPKKKASTFTSVLNIFPVAGVINKGNTCHVAAILHCLNVIPGFWSSLSSTSPVVVEFIKIITSINSSKAPVDPSRFLKVLQDAICASHNSNFKIQAQHDVAEVLVYLLSCFESAGFNPSENLSIRVRSSWSCDVCYQELANDESTEILPLSVCASIQESFDKFGWSYRDDSFCYYCGSIQDGETKKSIVDSGSLLIAQLKRFTTIEGITGKIEDLSFCSSPDILVPIATDTEVTLRRAFRLKGMICHSGTVENGHYTAHVYVSKSGKWFHCNDSIVTPTTLSEIEDDTVYVLIYTHQEEV